MATMTPEEQIALVKRIAAVIAMFEPGDSGYPGGGDRQIDRGA